MAKPRRYPQELRERAVHMVAEIGERGAIGRVADQLGMHRETLTSWVRLSRNRRRPEAGHHDRASPGQRDPEVRECLFRTRARPKSVELTAYIDSTGCTRFGVEPIRRALDWNPWTN